MKLLLNLIINTVSVYIAAYIVPGVKTDLLGAAIASVVLGVLNTFLKPILLLLTLPITILTLGLFALVLNTIIVLLVSVLVPGFVVDSFLSAFLFGILLSLVSFFLNRLK
ncbi:hypothetical protein A3F07_04180 [candidate division WWE3 bacterium RIFCSPHIGHO2_12_FULL_38_15]|uniref:Phage holin family protein n=1 Tax=candidate division WWE3 bacterium RIFCSPHIGHO2_02_FULL_38_14 TaxID=1802620 RepID=A0A1F4V871_UNCKA|nr:MAG: hypothetical protein A2793_01380 [candidate division WWE3 bacterium RIFCSPHIGHO2_01_FULL_38_45]OGC48493.1 MAG: hypothetical protein A3F07_04180 [candidate division WWE3 bacterium RIFCSPHIGHO2_12_FULL_38_15]OGC53346.1 MAG: hypothetical protein A3D91_02970 [candidate division WWE3 bacterium RIFCSPHIGHO2_02_FULL_38_14]OGC53842.1 MAG: hypothetical protein A3B64_00695 [candidate division WWE3 bacterium RIFCSPLOWO2_01_FULL_37_24]HLB51860.1 phage holin family protein [Patescibacteria group bac